jgi:hypothetical protein
MLDHVTLVAMSPSGSTLVLRDRGSRLWLYPPAGAGQPRVIDPELAEQVIARGDLDRVGRDFEGWDDLDAFRQKRAAKATPTEVVDVESLDLHDVELMMEVAERWLAGGEGDRARQLALRLLRVPAVRSDADANDRLVGFIEKLGRPDLRLHSEPTTTLQARAYERWELPRAA